MISAVDPDLQIKRGPGHPDRDTSPPLPPLTYRERGSGLNKTFFRLFGPQFGLKIRGAQAPRAPPLDTPLDLTPLFSHFYLDLFSVTYLYDKNPTVICKQLRTSRGSLKKSSRKLAEIPGQYNLILDVKQIL